MNLEFTANGTRYVIQAPKSFRESIAEPVILPEPQIVDSKELERRRRQRSATARAVRNKENHHG